LNKTTSESGLALAFVAILLAVAAARLLAAGSGPDSVHSAAAKGDPAKGKKIYSVKCVACHKADGSGGVKVTTVATPDWRDSIRMSDPRYDDAYLRECITSGRPQSGMVPWAKQGMKSADIENLIAYIHTFSAPATQDARKSAKTK
jgi:cytochrome c oxidase cbb3-type subunit 3